MTITNATTICILVTTDAPSWNERRRWSAIHWEDYDGNWARVQPAEAKELESAYQSYLASREEV